MDNIKLTSTYPRSDASHLVQDAFKTIQTNQQEGLRLAEVARIQAEKLQDKQSLAGSLSVLSSGNYRLGNYDTALEYGLEALSTFDPSDQSNLLINLFNTLGSLYLRFGDYSEALRYFQRQEALGELRQDDYHKAEGLGGQASAYGETGDHERALANYQVALALFREIDHPNRVVTTCNNICHMLWELGRYEHAVEAGYQGLEASKDDRTFVRAKAWLLSTLALPLQELQRFAEADSMYQAARELAREVEDRQLMSNLTALRGRYYISQGDYANAQVYLNAAIEQSDALGTRKSSLVIHELLIKIFKEQGDAESAMRHYERVMALRKALFNESVLAKMRHLEIAQRTEVSRKKAELAEAHSAELENRVIERTAQLEDALKKAEMLRDKLGVALEQEALINAQRSSLIKTVSHAFRTPMTVIRTSSDILKKYNERLTPTKRDDYFERIEASINELSQMLQDAITADSHVIDRIQPNRSNYRFAKLGLTLERTLIAELADSSRVTFVFDRTSNQAVCLDEALLKQVLFNLLSNAIKFCPDGEIEARLTLEGSVLEISIIDQGIGIPPADIDNLFELFGRASNAETERGLGLGLYMAQQIVTAMRGSISAESPGLNQGSTFTIRLPTKL